MVRLQKLGAGFQGLGCRAETSEVFRLWDADC